jgi:shikimate dehydrogenase
MSPAMLGAAFEAAGVDAVYLPFELGADPGGFVRAMIERSALGFSVTIPHKIAVMAALDELEPAASHVGAVNTVLVRDGRIVGTNTDLYGALDAISGAAGGKERLAGRRALVLGAGGAARAIVFGLREAGAAVALTDIVSERAAELAHEAGARALEPERAASAGFDILANATPVGMHPDADACPFDASRLRGDEIVFDAVYNPLETRLLREAASRGCRTVRGVEMFVRQGARQFGLWTGLEPPVDVMRETVLARLGGRR